MNRVSAWLACLLMASANAAATTVYKTVDARGVVSYSDQPPPEGQSAEVLQLQTSAREPSALDRERLDAMRETTDRMAADRRAREQARLEARRLALESRPREIVTYYPQSTVIGGYYRGYRNHYRPGHRPDHPSYPNRPGRPVVAPFEWRGLNDYPASLVRRSYGQHARAAFMHPTVPSPRPYRGVRIR